MANGSVRLSSLELDIRDYKSEFLQRSKYNENNYKSLSKFDPKLSENDTSANYEVINLSGRQFLVSNQAFSRIKSVVERHACIIFNKILSRSEYFLTRNADCFAAILDFIENGDLHITNSVCPLALKKELIFWRIDFQNLKNCCKLKIYVAEDDEKDISAFDLNTTEPDRLLPDANKWQNIRNKGWKVLNNSPPNKLGISIQAIKLLAIMLFVFEITASTYSFFQTGVRIETQRSIARSESKITQKKRETKPNFEDFHKKVQTVTINGSRLDVHFENRNENLSIRAAKISKRSNRSRVLHIVSSTLENERHLQNSQKLKLNYSVQSMTGKGNDVLINSMHKDEKNNPQYNPGAQHYFRSKENDTTVNDDYTRRERYFKTEYRYLLSKAKTLSECLILRTQIIHYLKELRNELRHAFLKLNDYFKICNTTLMNTTHKRKRDIGIKRVAASESGEDDEDIVVHDRVLWLKQIEIALAVYFVVEYFVELSFSPRKQYYIVSLHSLIDGVSIGSLLITYIWVDLFHPELKYSSGILWSILRSLPQLKALKLFYFLTRTHIIRAMNFSFKKSYIDVFVLFTFLNIGIVIISFFMHLIEKETMDSIPKAMWWAMATITTLGYGDVVPSSAGGKVVGYILGMFSMMAVSFIVPIFIVDFTAFYNYSKVRERWCKKEHFANVMKKYAEHPHQGSLDPHPRPKKDGSRVSIRHTFCEHFKSRSESETSL